MAMSSEGFNFDRFIKAFESKDVEATLSFFADDVEIYSEDNERPIKGKRVLRQFSEEAFPAMKDVHLKPLMVIQKGDQVAALVETRASYSADFNLPGGVHLPLSGKSIRLNTAMFLTLNEQGQIVWMHRMRDTASAMKQLGIRPEELERIQREVMKAAAQVQA